MAAFEDNAHDDSRGLDGPLAKLALMVEDDWWRDTKIADPTITDRIVGRRLQRKRVLLENSCGQSGQILASPIFARRAMLFQVVRNGSVRRQRAR